MINQYTNSYLSIASTGVFAGRSKTTSCALTLRDSSIAAAAAEKSARVVFAVADRHATCVETVALTTPVAIPEMTTPVANFWKQLIGGNGPPAPEPLLLT